MILWWLGDAVLILVVCPIVALLLAGVLTAATAIPPTIGDILGVAEAASKDLNAVPLLFTTQAQVIKTVEVVANYGGSLDVIIDDN